MPDNSFPTALPTRQAAAIEGRSRRGAVTGKLRTALDLTHDPNSGPAESTERVFLRRRYTAARRRNAPVRAASPGNRARTIIIRASL